MKTEYSSQQVGGKGDTTLVLCRNGRGMKTPGKRPLAHQNLSLHRALVAELSKTKHITPAKLSLYSMLCTQIDFLETGIDPLAKKIEAALLQDIAFRTCAGPEVGYQMEKLDFLLKYLKKNKLQHPCFMQTISGKDLKKTIKKGSKEDKNFKRLVEVVTKEYRALPIEKRCAVVNSTSIHQTTILGLLLVLGHCTPEEYAHALNAANCIGDGAWGDTNEEKAAFKGACADAKILQEYSSCAEKPSLKI